MEDDHALDITIAHVSQNLRPMSSARELSNTEQEGGAL